MDLQKFLVEAKKSTWASGAVPLKLENGFEKFTYVDPDSALVYTDEYYARDPKPFGGRELVLLHASPIWMMNYFGGINLSEGLDVRAINDFLRTALSRVPENIPFRGPRHFVGGGKEYHNTPHGDFKRFRGHERIVMTGKKFLI